VGLDREQVFQKVRSHLAEELGVPSDSIAETTHFRDDLDADSLDLYELVMELEDTYGVKMSEQEAEGIVTVGQAVDFVVTRT
jgi:acyl carrier protein